MATTKTRKPSKSTTIDMVPVGDVVLDSEIQPREHINTQVIGEYAEAMRDGAEFPPIIVFKTEDGKLYAADGWHRTMAARQAGLEKINAETRTGTKRDAVLYSVTANTTHGIRRTDADKRRAVIRLLTDPEWKEWSANVIAQRVGVSQPFVSGLREKLDGVTDEVKTASGTTMKTGRIGRPRKEKAAPEAEPEQDGAEEQEGATATNGAVHDPLAFVSDDLGDDGLEDIEINDVSSPLTFSERLIPMLEEILAEDPQETFAALDDTARSRMISIWNDVIDRMNAYADLVAEAAE